MEKKTIFIMCKKSDYPFIASLEFEQWLKVNKIRPTTHNIWLPYEFSLVHEDADKIKDKTSHEKMAWFFENYPIFSSFYQVQDLENMIRTEEKNFTLQEKLRDAKEKLTWIKEAYLIREDYNNMPNISNFVCQDLLIHVAKESYEPYVNDFKIVLRHNLKKYHLEYLTDLMANYHHTDYNTFVNQMEHMILDFTNENVKTEKEELDTEFQFAVENKVKVYYDITNSRL